MYLIDLIQIDGTPEQQAKIRAICVKTHKAIQQQTRTRARANSPLWTTRTGSNMESFQKPHSAQTNVYTKTGRNPKTSRNYARTGYNSKIRGIILFASNTRGTARRFIPILY